MSAEILIDTPKSGDYPEKHFGTNFNSQLWIKFVDNNFTEWVACFGKRYQSIDKVLTNSTNETAYIITGGQGFFIDIKTRELIHELDDLPTTESLILTHNPEYFLIGACYYIYIFDDKQFIKCYEPSFPVDGIYFTKQIGQKAIGHLYSYRFQTDFNVGFEFDLITNEISVNENLKYRYDGPFEFVQVIDSVKQQQTKESFLTKLIKRIIDR